MAPSKEKQSSALPKRKSSRSVGAVRRHAEQKKDAEAAVLVRARKDSFLLLRLIQQSDKRNTVIEELTMKTLELVREQREDNRLMRLAAIRLTAGFIAGVGEHD